jgi:hypothetical protein
MGSINCTECGNLFSFDVMPRRGAVCFKCHVGSIRLGFSHGKEDFHGPTIKERQDQQVAQAKAAGINAQPVGNRWV